MGDLKPFWQYYGGKYRAAPRYPLPRYGAIVEPFAGAAGYSCRYPDLAITLVEQNPTIAETWRYLINASSDEIRRIPEVTHVDDLPGWVSEGGRLIVGWWMNAATVSPGKQLSSGRKKLAVMGRRFEGWTDATRERIASQVSRIRHWKLVEGDYATTSNTRATWFIDPPYNNKAGSYYKYSDIDYAALGEWCRSRQGQTIVCENVGATWLPFRPFMNAKAGPAKRVSAEAIWTNG